MQIASAGLALPLIFAQAILGQSILGGELPWTLYCFWVSLLLCVFFGLTYQWLAVRPLWDQFHNAHKTLENSQDPGFRESRWIFKTDRLNPSVVYLGMTATFVLGGVFFILFVWLHPGAGAQALRHIAEPMI